MVSYSIRAEALDDLDAIAAYIFADNPVRSVTFVDELVERFEVIAERPLSFPQNFDLPPEVCSARQLSNSIRTGRGRPSNSPCPPRRARHREPVLTASNLATRRQALVLGAGALAAGALPGRAMAKQIQPGLLEITGNDARAAAAAIGMLTAVPVGSGRQVTAYMSSLCSVCQAFLRDYPSLAVPGVAMRYVPTILAEQESGAVERVLAQPDLATFRRFMARAYADAPPIAFDRSVTIRDVPATPRQRYSRQMLLIAAISHLFRRNGSPDLPEGTPRFLFTSQTGAAYMVVGTPTPEMFRDIVRLR